MQNYGHYFGKIYEMYEMCEILIGEKDMQNLFDDFVVS